jgi:hypothetical protein
MSRKKKNKNFLLFLIFFLLGGFLIKFFKLLFGKRKSKLKDFEHNFKDFFEKEEKEVEELISGEESFKEYCEDSSNLFKDYFIPHNGNDHKPKILRAKPLLIIVIISVLLKVGIGAYLFFIYPNIGIMQPKMIDEIITLTNRDRENNNLNPLTINPVLSKAALSRANDMVANNYFSHYGLDGKNPWDWIDREEYPYLNVGENLAMNFLSADSAHSALMQSPLHKKNILNANYQEIGLAIINGKIDDKDTTILVEIFATKKSETKEPLVLETEPENTAKEEIKQETKNDEIKVLASESIASDIQVKEEEPKKPEEEPLIQPENQEAEIIKEKIINQEDVEENIEKIEEESAEEFNINEEQINLIKADILNRIKEEDEKKALNTRIESEKNLNQELIAIEHKDNKIRTGIALITFSKYSYIIVASLIVLILIINIIIRIEIQHKPVIMQSLLVVMVLLLLIFVEFNSTVGIDQKIFIL